MTKYYINNILLSAITFYVFLDELRNDGLTQVTIYGQGLNKLLKIFCDKNVRDFQK